ncbi:MAG: DUF1015 family protein [Lawsonibacter sp.]
MHTANGASWPATSTPPSRSTGSGWRSGWAPPSTLRLILPESRLEGPDTQADITEINSTMSHYLREGRFQVHPDAVFYIERTLDGGKVRRGLVGRIDLEQYDYEPGSAAPIRATEGTVLSRIPPRVAVRKNAPIELPHVMLLADDPGRTVIEPLSGQTAEMRPLYDFDLMERGGHIRGWELTPAQWGADRLRPGHPGRPRRL